MTAFAQRVDVLIVGSGPAGASYARTISDAAPSASILVVEAGPVITDPPAMHTANITDAAVREAAETAAQGPTPYRYQVPSAAAVAERGARPRDEELLNRAGLFRVGTGDLGGDGFPAAQATSNVGGMGSLWFGACPRPSVDERIPYLDPAALDRAYALAERYLGVSATQFQGSVFAEHVRTVIGAIVNPGRPPDRWVQAMPLAASRTTGGVRRSGAGVIFGPLLTAGRPGFEVRPRTRCLRVLMDGPRAVGAELEDVATGTVARVGAAVVVVAADALRTPQLLFASGIRPPALGHYLNEHPQVSVLARVAGLEPRPAPAARGVTATMAEPRVRTVPDSGASWLPYGAEDFPFHGNLLEVDPASLPTGDGPADLRPVLSVHLFLPQEPRFENRVEFSDTDTDWAGLPSMRFHLTLSARDDEVVRRARRVALEISTALGGPIGDTSLAALPAGSSLHYQGTVRMGDHDDGTSVCDPDSRVWNTENLFVAGNGVIPTTTACNPTLTTVALAAIGGRRVAEQLDGSAPPATRSQAWSAVG